MSGDDTRNYQELTDAQLAELEADNVAEFERLRAEADGAPSADQYAQMTSHVETVEAVRAEQARREAEATERAAQADDLMDRITRPAAAPTGEPEAPASTATDTTADDTDETDGNDPAPPADEADTTTETPDGDTTLSEVTVPDSPAELTELVASMRTLTEAVTAQAQATTAAITEMREHYSPARTRPAAEAKAPKLNPTMAELAARAPAVDTAPKRSVLVASADVPGYSAGQELSGISDLRKAMNARARHLNPVAGGAQRIPVATMRKEHRHVVGEFMSRDQVDQIIREVTNPSDMETLVAAGGWCAPSEISYDFFSDVCRDGGIDLPTVGVNRGGIKWPTSPSYGDIVASQGLWRWTETQDAAAVTGTAQSGTKTCVHVPCADFDEARLDCDGLCLEAGNLASDAFPEAQDNFLDLLQAGHFHTINGLKIQQLVAASVPVSGTVGLGATGGGLVANLLGAIALQAQDYRAKFRMCVDSVLEVVLPLWIRDAMRSDLIRRNGIAVEPYADQQIMTWFDVRNVRVQWVYDFQNTTIGGVTPAMSWPSIVQFLIFSPGTFVLGEGMTLDLGVIRDSTLNSTNDHTAAWMEECWLIAKRGHESRFVTVNICPDGTTGAADLTACGP